MHAFKHKNIHTLKQTDTHIKEIKLLYYFDIYMYTEHQKKRESSLPFENDFITNIVSLLLNGPHIYFLCLVGSRYVHTPTTNKQFPVAVNVSSPP